MIHETRERITFAAEGVALGAEELAEAIRDRALLAVGVLAVVGAAAVLLVSGFGGSTESTASAPTPQVAATAGAKTISERGYSLTLPAGWTRSPTPGGALFAAASDDGRAQTTLWAQRKPDLSFDGFVADSLAGLAELGTGARISDRVEGPTLETSSAQLRAEVSLSGRAPGPYRVDLRAAGPYRYYLATSIAAGAPPRLLGDAELLGSSLRPAVELRGLGDGGR